MPLTISSRHSGGAWIIRPAGSMTLGSGSEQVREALIAQYDAGFRHLIIDCSQLTAVDSQALGEMVSAYSSIVRRGGSLRLLHPSRRLVDLLRITGLDRLLECFDDEHAATQHLDFQSDRKAKAALDAFLE